MVALLVTTALFTTAAVADRRELKAPPGAVVVSTDPPVWLGGGVVAKAPKPDAPHVACPDAQRAISFYRQAYRAHRETMRMAGPVPRVWYRACDVVRRRAAEWRDRASAAREQLAEWRVYHFHWWEWLPANWQALGACETGYGRRPGNFAHANSRFVSAFGISRSIYDRDAAHMGAPPWDDARPPTPREQYLAALGHLDLWGDGWTCPGP